jgi:hypothetical protein
MRKIDGEDEQYAEEENESQRLAWRKSKAGSRQKALSEKSGIEKESSDSALRFAGRKRKRSEKLKAKKMK